LDAKNIITSEASVISSADKIILTGIGHFKFAMKPEKSHDEELEILDFFVKL
tara:strand:- start:4444 stop:4599 length:156 start_codon:yes stop_codon:yes gene_type:complete